MFELPKIPYLDTGIKGFLTPHAVQIHATKHHQAYIDNANKLVAGTENEGKSLEELCVTAVGGLFNNVAQIYNHNFFWNCLTAEYKEIPEEVEAFFEKNFGSLTNFKDEFATRASTLFGSGWCYLYVSKEGQIMIGHFANAHNPLKDGGFPLLTVDTWEHAWYIDYENRKAEYFKNFWTAVNWEFVGQRLREAKLI